MNRLKTAKEIQASQLQKFFKKPYEQINLGTILFGLGSSYSYCRGWICRSFVQKSGSGYNKVLGGYSYEDMIKRDIQKDGKELCILDQEKDDIERLTILIIRK